MQKEKKIAAERAKKEQAKRAQIRKREKEIAAAKAQKLHDAENAVKALEQKKIKAEIAEKRVHCLRRRSWRLRLRLRIRSWQN